MYWDEEAPLHLAAYCGYNHLVTCRTIMCIGKNTSTPYLNALNQLELMLDNGVDVDSYNVFSDDSGYEVTALHFAVYKNKGMSDSLELYRW